MAEEQPIAFEGARKTAEVYAKNPAKVAELLDEAQEKARQEEDRLRDIWEHLHALLRLVAAWLDGRYTVIPWKTIVLAIASIIYFVNPFDLILDFLPGVGYLDDIAVIGFVMNSIRKDIARFLDWESSTGPSEPVS